MNMKKLFILLKVCIFGVVYCENRSEIRLRNFVLGGVEIDPKVGLFMGSLQRKADRAHLCAGILYTLKHLVTTCSCVGSAKTKLPLGTPAGYIVVAGDKYYTNKQPSNTRNVTSFDVHEKCKYDPQSKMWDYNIGYIKLEKPFDAMPDKLKPIQKLPSSQGEYEAGLNDFIGNKAYQVGGDKYCETFGWGMTSIEKKDDVFDAKNLAESLKKRALQLVTIQDCRARLCGASDTACKFQFQRNQVVCAVSAGDGDGPLCYGDSGAPLLCDQRLWGIGAETEECGRTIKASVFYKLDIADMMSRSKSHVHQIIIFNLLIIINI